jgi:hypothetical protein
VDAQRVKSWAAVLLAAAALVTALRPPPEDAAKAGYLELTKAILETQEETRTNHEDLEKLREFVADYAEQHKVVSIETPVDAGAAGAPPVQTQTVVRNVTAFAAPDAAAPPPMGPFKPPAKPRSAREVYSAW